MGDTTTYKVETVYAIKDEGSRALQDLTKHSKETAASLEALNERVESLVEKGKHFAEAYFGYEAAKKVFEYDQAVQGATNTLGGLLSITTGADLDKSFDRATMTMERMEKVSWKTGMNVKTLLGTVNQLTQPLLSAGMSLTEIEKMSVNISKTAEAYGKTDQEVSMRVMQAVQFGILGRRDPFMHNLLNQKELGKPISEKKFHDMTPAERAALVNKALGSEKINATYEKQEQTSEKLIEDIEQHATDIANKALRPVFQEVNNALKDVNGWLEKNHEKVEKIGHVIGKDIVTGMKFLRDVFKFIYDHSDTFLAIAKGFAAIKIGQMVGGGMGKYLEWAEKLARSGMEKKEGAGSWGASAGTAFGVGYGIGELLNKAGLQSWMDTMITDVKTLNGVVYDMSDRTTRKFVSVETAMGSFDKSVQGARDHLNELAEAGAKGAKVSEVSARYEGDIKNREKQQAAIEKAIKFQQDTYAGKTGRSPFETNLIGGDLVDQLKKSGLFDYKDLEEIRRNPQAYLEKLQKHTEHMRTRQSSEEKAVDDAWAKLPKEMKAGLDQQVFANKAMEKLNQDVKQKGKTEVTIDPDLLKQILAAIGADDPDKPFKGANPPEQNVTINIQRVMAKDPNRWLADMDDVIGRRTRNPTRAKRGWKSRK